MAGCFGNNWEDRARERELDAYLKTQEVVEECVHCHYPSEDLDEDNLCPACVKEGVHIPTEEEIADEKWQRAKDDKLTGHGIWSKEYKLCQD